MSLEGFLSRRALLPFQAVTMAIIGLFAAVSALGSVHSVLIGLDANPASNQAFDYQSRRDRMTLAIDSGVNYIYVHPTWAAIEPTAGSYDFSDVDFNAQLADDNNLPVALNLRIIDTNVRAVPAAYSGWAFDDPNMTQALVNALRAMAPHLRNRVQWVALGNEVDSYFTMSPNDVLPYQRLMQSVLPVVRAVFPAAQFSINFTFKAAPFLNNQFSPLTSMADYFSYTYYPYTGDYIFSDPSTVNSDISQMIYAAGGKPVLFQEIGYPSSSILNSSPNQQATFLQNVFTALRFYSGQVIGANFVWMSDLPASMVDQLTQYYGFPNDTSFRAFLSTLGYWDINDVPKAAWSVFKQNAPAVHWILDQPGASLLSSGNSPSLSVGYGQLNASGGSAPVSGMAIMEYRQGGVLISEASVPDSPPVTAGRMYAEMGNGISTGVAMANPGTQASQVTFHFTDQNGVDTPSNTFVLPASGQLSVFLDQYPFNLGSLMRGTLTFSAPTPISAITIRGHMNERSEFLFSTGQVSDMSSAPGPVEIPHFADGGGWQTEVMLINPTGAVIQGTVQFFDPGTSNNAGGPRVMATTATTANTFSYSIPPNSSWSLTTLNTGAATTVGSVHITPASGQAAPAGSAVLSFHTNGITVSEAAVAIERPAQSYLMFVESSDVQPLQTGVAIANASGTSIPVTLELITLDGAPTGKKTTVNVPGNGQLALFMDQIPGLAWSSPFQGVLRISAQSPSIFTIGFRGRYNERRDFLIATMFPVSGSQPAALTSLVFPQIVDGSGYSTRIVVFNRTTQTPFSGSLQFFSQSGQSLNVWLNDLSSP
jgi:hypothetical protein